ncbi:uncharacterized protein UHOD_11435 [Ustilago sp. UG-2017b]|nr:uncharacterized protein UHOD_11435 [Ustilago sp. UG-2017b]
MLVGVETPSRYDSDDDDKDGDEMHYNIDTISKLNPKVLKGMLIELTKCNKVRNSMSRDRESGNQTEHSEQLSRIHDTLKEAPKLMTKNWYAWNPRFRGILSNWPVAMKHLDCTVAPEDKKYDRALDSKLCTILQSSACHGTGCAGSRKNRKSYEEERRNHRIGKNEGLRQSSSRSVVERLYDRFRPNRSHNKTDVEDIGFATLMKQGAHSTMNSEQEDGQDERGVQVVTQMKWEWPLLVMKQHEDFPSTRSKGSSANERCHKAGRTVRRESQRGGGAV